MFVIAWRWIKEGFGYVLGRFGVFLLGVLDTYPVFFTLVFIVTVQVLESGLKVDGVVKMSRVIGLGIVVSGGVAVIWLLFWLMQHNEVKILGEGLNVSQSGFARIKW